MVIERSDTSKIIFKCKTRKEKNKNCGVQENCIQTMIRKHTSCPFKIRANYSVRNKVWTLLIVSDEHDHVVDLPWFVGKNLISNTIPGSSLNVLDSVAPRLNKKGIKPTSEIANTPLVTSYSPVVLLNEMKMWMHLRFPVKGKEPNKENPLHRVLGAHW